MGKTCTSPRRIQDSGVFLVSLSLRGFSPDAMLSFWRLNGVSVCVCVRDCVCVCVCPIIDCPGCIPTYCLVTSGIGTSGGNMDGWMNGWMESMQQQKSKICTGYWVAITDIISMNVHHACLQCPNLHTLSLFCSIFCSAQYK